MAKIRVQAQHLKAGDIVGSGEEVVGVIINSVNWPSNKICVGLQTPTNIRNVLWGKYTMINVERKEG